jgi:hypothetical protein
VDTGQVRPITFPVAGPVTYTNDFGACRDGCTRVHKGIDVIGDQLQPLLAVREGVIDHFVDHPTAGYGVVIRDREGWEYSVYHVNNDTPGTDDGADDGEWRFARGIVPGSDVRAGQLIAWIGDSGNSEGSVPHAHVEIRRPDGEAINPYWSLRQAQRDVNCSIATVDRHPTERADRSWFERDWATVTLPGEWRPLRLTGGRPGTGIVGARMWVGPRGYTPVDAAALRVGDPRYDEDAGCTERSAGATEAIAAELEAILTTIRAMESGGDYSAESATSTASGAYQFIDSSWGGYGGFVHAGHAPPDIQDAKAAQWVTAILARNAGDVGAVPVTWYLGHVPTGTEWDSVPPQPGNRLTPRQYQDRWMQIYADLLGAPDLRARPTPDWLPVDVSRTCHHVVVDFGPPGEPQYGVIRAGRFAAESTGRAVPNPDDPCDRTRPKAVPPGGSRRARICWSAEAPPSASGSGRGRCRHVSPLTMTVLRTISPPPHGVRLLGEGGD